MNWAKLLIPSHSEPLQWEKIGKVANQAKLAVPSHSEPLQWYHLVVWSQFAFGSLPPPPQNRSFAVGSFGYFHLVVWSQFAFGSLLLTHPPPPPPPPSNYHDLIKIFWTGFRLRITKDLPAEDQLGQLQGTMYLANITVTYCIVPRVIKRYTPCYPVVVSRLSVLLFLYNQVICPGD